MPRRPLKGYKPDLPDPRDLTFREDYLRVGKLRQYLKAKLAPKKVDLRELEAPPVYDQGDVGSCVDNALCTVLGILTAKDGGGAMQLSRLFAYYNARNGVPEDEGSTLRDALKGVVKHGICLESAWPYDTSRWAEKPQAFAWIEGHHRRKNLRYYRLQTLNGMKLCLAQGHAFMFGVMVFSNFSPDPVTHVIPTPTDYEAPEGGHAMTMMGYDDTRKLFLLRNSWGNDWGDNGHAWIHYDYIFNSDAFYDAWTVRRFTE